MEIRIEPIDRKHAKDTWQYRNDPDIWKFTSCDTPLPATLNTEEQCYIFRGQDPKNRMYAIMVDDVAVGAVTLKQIGFGTAAIGYYILMKDLWGNGICKEAVRQVMEIGFDELDLDLLYLWVHSDNVASFKVARSLGFYSVAMSFTNMNVHRLEMTKTVWKSKKNELK